MIAQKNMPDEPALKIGSLVFVKTHSYLDDLNSWTTTQANPTIPYISPSITINPGVGGQYPYGPSPYGGGTTTAPYPYISYPGAGNITWTSDNIDINEDDFELRSTYNDIINDCNGFSASEESALKELYDAYLSKPSGGGNSSGGNTLGMAVWNGKPGSNKKNKKNKVKQGTYNISNNNRKNWSITTTTVGTGATSGNTVSVNLPTSFDMEYYAKGYKKVEDYFTQNTVQVKQDEGFSEEEIEAYTKSGDMLLHWGKPFKGIVVDVFAPKLKTESGVEVTIGVNKLPKMYKVLIGEKDCLWFTEEDVYAMVNKEK